MDPEVEELYGLSLEEFTKARDALARSRRKEQGKEAGAAVKALRKPSVIAWALNQLARRHPEDIEVLLEAGTRLRRAQIATLEGGEPDELRDATRAEAAEVQALAGQARSILAEAGKSGSAAQEERLGATLRAAAVDEVAGDLLKRGVLTEELSPAGFGFGVADDTALPDLPSDFRASTADSPRSTHESRKELDEDRDRDREREQQLQAAREAAACLEREADKAEERAQQAREAANAAMARAEALAKALR